MRDTAEGLIYVDRQSLIRTRLNARQLRLKAIRHLGRAAGGHLSRFKARGMEFEEARPYQAGDDIRSMDWLVTARTGKPHTKLFREEKERAVLFCVDFRQPMHFATQGKFKSVMASQAASALAWAASKIGDRIGGLTFSEEGHHEMRPARGDRSVMRLIAQLSDASKNKAQQTSQELSTESLNHALKRLNQVTHPGSLIFILSDFRGLNDKSHRLLSQLSRHNDIILLHIYDQLEKQLPSSGNYAVKGQGKKIWFNARQQNLAQAHHQQFKLRQDEINEICQRYQMHELTCSTNEDIFDTLNKGLGTVRP